MVSSAVERVPKHTAVQGIEEAVAFQTRRSYRTSGRSITSPTTNQEHQSWQW